MSGLLADAGAIELTELEEMFAKDIPCEYQDCGKPAKWVVTAIPCGHSMRCCSFHKILELKQFEFEVPLTYCHMNRKIHVTKLEVTEL